MRVSFKGIRNTGFSLIVVLVFFMMYFIVSNNIRTKYVLDEYLMLREQGEQLETLKTQFLNALACVSMYQRNKLYDEELTDTVKTIVRDMTQSSKELDRLLGNGDNEGCRLLRQKIRMFKTAFYTLFHTANDDVSSATTRDMEQQLPQMLVEANEGIIVLASDVHRRTQSLSDLLSRMAHREGQLVLFVSTFIFCTIIVVIFLMSRFYAAVVNSITLRMNEIAHGNFCVKDNQYNDAEMKVIFGSMNDMAKKLAESMAAQEGAYHDLKCANSELEFARAHAEELSVSKSQLLANMSHEIRTPMNCIVGFSEAIIDSHTHEEARSHAKQILEESDAMLVLVNDLLDNAKIESGKMELDIQSIDLIHEVNRIKKMFLPLCVEKKIQCVIHRDTAVPQYVMADALRLRQVLMNLVSNAIKFTIKGSVTVDIALEEMIGNDAKIRFSVIDTGVGIPAEKQKMIFDVYQQADASTVKTFGGTGLGTTIAQQFVQLMGGTIAVESEMGKGSTFHFTIVLPKSAGGQSFPRPTTKEPRNEGAASGQASILIADDYPVNQQVLRMHLEHAGYTVTAVDNGKDAVEVCRQNAFDVIFMDIQMPEMDGYAATREIRSGGGPCAESVIIALTASASKKTETKCFETGMNAVMTKPIRRKDVMDTVRKVIG